MGIPAPDRKKETGRQDMSILSMYGKRKRKKKEKRKLITINNEMLHNAAWDAAQFKRLERRPHAVPIYAQK